MNRRVLCLFVFSLVACDATAPGDVTPPDGTETLYPDSWAHAMPEDRGEASILPVPEEAEEGRFARRMSVDQLRRSIPVLFDGITWNVAGRNGAQSGFDALARTLGEADYIQATTNNEEPSPLFAKFMEDMAANVCDQAIRRDLLAAPGAPRLIVQEDGDVDGTLRFLRLKLHGIHVPDDSTEGLEDLRALYDDVASAQQPQVAWFAVCIAMLTAPEFMAY